MTSTPGAFTSDALQAAVDACAGAGGGVVQLDAGIYDLTGPVRLRSGIELRGAGSATILRKRAAWSSPLAIDADYGEQQLTVVDASGFGIGMGLQVRDDLQRWGWDESTAVITAVEGNVVHFDRRLQRDYQADAGGVATSASSLLIIEEAQAVGVHDLTLDGQRITNPWIGGCRAGGIYLYAVNACRISGVAVRDFNGDGISWQITQDITLERCTVTGCAGSGLHPGSGSRRTRIVQCDSSGHEECGLFICWRVQQGEFRDNRFCSNQQYGLSIGHKDSDNHFVGNELSRNGRAGIVLRPERPSNGAHRNRWERNTIEDNGTAAEGAGILVHPHHEDNLLVGNLIRATLPDRQGVPVRLLPESVPLVFESSAAKGAGPDA
jgi:hypothetical protein